MDETSENHIIEISFSGLGSRDRAYAAIEKLLGEMGQIGTLSAHSLPRLDDLMRDAARYRWLKNCYRAWDRGMFNSPAAHR